MPKWKDDMVAALRRQGHSEESAWKITNAHAKAKGKRSKKKKRGKCADYKKSRPWSKK